MLNSGPPGCPVTQGHGKTDCLCLYAVSHSRELEHSRWGFCPRSGWCHPDSLLLSASRRGCRCSMLAPPSSPERSVAWTQICAASLTSRPTCVQCWKQRQNQSWGFFRDFKAFTHDTSRTTQQETNNINIGLVYMWRRDLNYHWGRSLFKSLKSGLPHTLNFKVEWMMIWE